MPVDFPLYLITDRSVLPSGRSLTAAVAAALAGGVRAVQLREKDLTDAEIFPLAQELRRLTRAYGARLLINGRIDLALAIEADGVHLGGGAPPVTAVRRRLGPKRLIGVSTHAAAEVASAAAAGADFVTFGPIFSTPSKVAYGPPLGLSPLATLLQSPPLPVFPLGGIDLSSLPLLHQAGSDRAALIRAILSATDPAVAARLFLAALTR